MTDNTFKLVSDFAPAGDQPSAIRRLVKGLRSGEDYQTLLGVTGSGKTFTLANVVAEVNRPALVISHNKTLAAQLYSELKNFFPHNAVEYFVSYYDYYQPEAYIPATDTYIAKDSSINEEIERLRLAATSSLLERRDVIIVASVSCIYGLGSPEDVKAMQIEVRRGAILQRDELLRRLVDMQYQRNDFSPERGCFRAAGDTVDIYLSYREDAVRVEFWGDEVERITRRDPLTNQATGEMDELVVFPAKHFAMPYERIERAEQAILEELDQVVRDFQKGGKLVEAQRIHQRTMYDLEMLREVGFCSGIENYSRHLAGRPPGSEPYTLLDFFPADYVTIIDESHVTVPQVSGMFKADRSRKTTLVEHGFRLPSALDNRPLNFEEFSAKTGQTLFASATPARYELERTTPVELVVRPTGLLDPEIIIRPLENQIDDFIEEVRSCAEAGKRVLCTTLTKRTAEDLSEYLRRLDVRVRYLHSEVNALERVEIIRDLRKGEFDCLVGINLLREGLDLPEVALVAILDADKEGFLRSETSLIQTAGRAARHVDGRVILYADTVTGSMRRMIETTEQRREKQQAFNTEHNITPRSVIRAIEDGLRLFSQAEEVVERVVAEDPGGYDMAESIKYLEEEMEQAADALEFERAAMIRDQIYRMKKKLES